MNQANVAVYDPGGEVDYFAMLTATLTRTKILLTGAAGLQAKDYPAGFDFYGFVESKIAANNKKFKFDYHLCEKNNYGTMVINSLKFKHKISVIPVTTSNNIKDADILRSGRAYNKNDSIVWINRLRAMGVIEFPKTMTPGLKLMKDHLDNFGAKKRAGKIVYEALSGHDDFVSCLGILVNFAKQRFLKLKEIQSQVRFDGSAAAPITMESANKNLARQVLEKKGTLFDRLDVIFPR